MSVKDQIKDAVFIYSLKKVVAEHLKLKDEDYSKMALDANLVSVFGMDSLDSMEIIMAVETLHNLEEIPEEEAKKSVTIGDIFNYVKQHSKIDVNDLFSFNDDTENKKRLISEVELITNKKIDNNESIDSFEKLEEAIK